MSNKTNNTMSRFFLPILIAVPALIMFLVLLYPSVKAAMGRETATEKIRIHEEELAVLLDRKSKLLSEVDAAQTHAEKTKKMLSEEQIKLDRAQSALQTAEELRKSVMADQMRFENLQRDLVATNKVLTLYTDTLRAESSTGTQELTTLQKSCAAQKAQLSALALEKKSLEEATNTLRNDLQTLQAQQNQYNKDIQEQKLVYAQNEEAGRKALNSLRNTEATLAQVTVEVSAEFKSKEALAQEKRILQQSVSELTNQVAALRLRLVKESEALKTASSAADNARADAISYSAQIAQLKTEIQAETKRKETQSLDTKALVQAYSEASKRLKDIQEQVAKEAETLKAIRTAVDVARADNVAYLGQTEQLKKDLLRLRSDLAETKKETK
jgi:chromosome segregation ATPase